MIFPPLATYLWASFAAPSADTNSSRFFLQSDLAESKSINSNNYFSEIPHQLLSPCLLPHKVSRISSLNSGLAYIKWLSLFHHCLANIQVIVYSVSSKVSAAVFTLDKPGFGRELWGVGMVILGVCFCLILSLFISFHFFVCSATPHTGSILNSINH